MYDKYDYDKSIVRFEKDGQYYYFTNDGKELDKSVVADENGRDPFGGIVFDEMEMKKRNDNVDKKVGKEVRGIMEKWGF